MLRKKIPFLRLLIPFCTGIAASLFIRLPATSVFLVSAACFAALLTFHISGIRDRNPVYGIILSFFLAATGFASGNAERAGLSDLAAERKTFAGVLTDFPERKDKTILLKVKLKASLTDSLPLKGNILVYHRDKNLSDRLLPGDILIFSCTPAEIVNNGNPCEFDYRSYMERRGFRYLAFTDRNDFYYVLKNPGHGLLYRAVMLRSRIVKLFDEKGLKGDGLALASAIALGEKSYLDNEQKDNFSKAGVMHVMAVSGLHAGILSLFIFWVLAFLKGKLNFLRVFIAIAVLWIFAFITGLAPSIVRASLMFSFLHAGRLMKRNPDPFNSMLASAFLILLVNPLILPDASFLLSFTAVAFIILFYNNIYRLFETRFLLTDKLWGLISVSVAAQAGTLPLTVMFFNRLPVLFLLSNIVIIPVASVVVISGFLTVILSFSGPLSDITAYILDKSSSLAGYMAELTASLPFSSVEGFGLGTAECMILMLLTGVIIDSVRKGSKSRRYLAILIFLLSLNSLFSNIRLKSGNELFIYNTRGDFFAGIRTGRTLNLFCYNDTIPQAVRRHCAQERMKLKVHKTGNKAPVMITAGQLNIIVAERMTTGLALYKPDILIITGSKVSDAGYIDSGAQVIYTSALPANRFVKPSGGNEVIKPWFVREKGCFMMKL